MIIPEGGDGGNDNPPETITDDFTFITNDNVIDLKIGETKTINYNLSINAHINWFSNDSNIVAVNEGVITGINYGNTTVTGTVSYNGRVKTISCTVMIYEGEKGVELNDISLPIGDLIIGVGKEYDLPITTSPANAYIDSISYSYSNAGIISVSGKKIKALSIGECTLMVTINKKVNKTIKVIVTEDGSDGKVVNSLEKLVLTSGNMTIIKGETKKIGYKLVPEDAYISSIKWESNNTDVVTVNDGTITGVNEGLAIVTMTVNEIFVGKINVKVNPKLTAINITSSTSLNLRIGEESQIKISLEPNDSDTTILYKSSNGNVSVSNTGLIKALNSGSSVVTVSSEDGKLSKNIQVTVRPKTGVIGGEGIWAYTDSRVVNPVRAGTAFFQNLASKGIGSLSGGIYSYSGYSYDIANSNLSKDGRVSMVRFYYPNGYDLSATNTFTFIGGAGERGWHGFFTDLDKDTSLIKSSGIIIIVSTKSSYHYQDAINATNFFKGIIKQKSGVINSVAGYSMGGPEAGKAAHLNNYDRLFIVDSYIDSSDIALLRNKEIYIYSPVGDSMYKHTRTTLNRIVNDGNFKNVTVVSNNKEIINSYSNKMLIVNPGSSQISGHGWRSFVNGNLYAFACK